MVFLLYLISAFILSPIVQLDIYKAVLLCCIKLAALVMCCKIIWGYLSIALGIFSKRNMSIITLYHKIKQPDGPVFYRSGSLIFY